jgi:hypothetical protein
MTISSSSLAAVAAALLAALGVSCLYDENDRCAPGSVYNAQAHACICLPGTVVSEGGCKAVAPDGGTDAP